MEAGCSALTDEELQAVVTRLQGDVRDKNSHLRAAQSDIQAIRDQIEERNNDRQLFMSKKLSIEEAAELVAEHEQLTKTLHCKQAELRSLQTQEQRELDEVRAELEKAQKYQLQVISLREHNMSSIGELKRNYEERQETCVDVEQRLREVKQEICTHKKKGAQRKKPKLSSKPLSVKLDHFILKSCRQAGLYL